MQSLLRNVPQAQVEVVSPDTDIHYDDNLIVDHANGHDQAIVTRDSDFPNRPICTISNGVIFIPQRLKLEAILDCLERLARSGRVESMGHGVCTIELDGVSIRSNSGEEDVPLTGL